MNMRCSSMRMSLGNSPGSGCDSLLEALLPVRRQITAATELLLEQHR